jgi:Predicted glycosyltransferases
VAWKGADLTINCLRSLQSEVASLPGCHVYVVDNASPDGAADTVDEAIRANGWSDWATLIRAPNNGGFAYGNNIVVRLAMKARPRPDYVLLLNPDTLVREGHSARSWSSWRRIQKSGSQGGDARIQIRPLRSAAFAFRARSENSLLTCA